MSYESLARVPEEWRRAAPLINGETAGVASSQPVVNPADPRARVGEVSLADSALVADAVAAATVAFPAWRDLGAEGRAAHISAGAAAVEARLDELAALVSAEVGKILPEARGEIAGSLALLRSFATLVRELENDEDRTGRAGTGGAQLVRVRHVPVGPVGVIGPWNTPVFLTFNGVAPSLAAGCTIVVKPPVEAPLALTATLRLLAEHLPAGVLNIVQGRGSVVGQALAEHPGIRALMFTGGTETGRTVGAAGAATVKKVALELGGNDPAIVLDDAVIDNKLVTELIAGSFAVSGQVCFNVKRIYVHRSRHDEFVERFLAAARGIIVGDPFDDSTHIGPMTTVAGYENALRLIDSAAASGAQVHSLGVIGASAEWDAGYYIAPTVVTGIAADHELVLDEQFAPIIPIVAFDTEDEAVAEANRTEFGLASSVWSSDLARAEALARRIEAGNTYINAHRLGASVALVPFGGVKQSGLGRTHGMHSLHHCTEEHAIVGFTDAEAQLPGIAHWQSIINKQEASR